MSVLGRVATTAGGVIGVMLMIAAGLALTLVDVWVFLRYGFLVWLIATPIALSILGLVVCAVGAVCMGIGEGTAWVFRKATRRDG